jgi:hypothetical protein
MGFILTCHKPLAKKEKDAALIDYVSSSVCSRSPTPTLNLDL